MNMKKIKMHYSASEINPWSIEMRVVDFNINSGIIYCELNEMLVTIRDYIDNIEITEDEIEKA